MLLRGETILQRLRGALQRTGDAQVHINILKILFQACTLLLSDLIQRIISLPLVAELLIPRCRAVPYKIDGCDLLLIHISF